MAVSKLLAGVALLLCSGCLPPKASIFPMNVPTYGPSPVVITQPYGRSYNVYVAPAPSVGYVPSPFTPGF